MEAGKGLCHQRAQKDEPVSFGRERVKLWYTGIPFPTHECSTSSLLLDSHVKWKRNHGFPKASHLPDVISMWIFLFKAQLFYLKILRGTVRSSCKMSIFKEESFRRQRVRSKQCKNRESRESKGGRKGGKGFGFASLQRNCFDTVSPLHEFSICLCQIHYFKPQSCQMLIFYGVLTWQANLSVESVSFSQSQDLQPRKMYMFFWPKVSTLQQEWVGKANHYILVPNNCYQNQCFYMKKIKHYEQHKK